jgi:hypothetical protein
MEPIFPERYSSLNCVTDVSTMLICSGYFDCVFSDEDYSSAKIHANIFFPKQCLHFRDKTSSVPKVPTI